MNDYSRFDVRAQSIVVSRRQADLVREAAETRLLRSDDAERADAPYLPFLGGLRRSIGAVLFRLGTPVHRARVQGHRPNPTGLGPLAPRS